MFTESLYSLDSWIKRNGWAGYDPYDIKGHQFFRLTNRSKIASSLVNFFLNQYPLFFRKTLRVEKQVNAKAMALFATAYLELYRKKHDENFLTKALTCLNWLIENPSSGYSGYCWGYPFDWQSRVFIPVSTPSGVVTSIAAHAFLDAYEILGKTRYLDIAKSCCNFILENLNMDIVADDEICFSYTPIDRFHVHNANLFSASLLLRSYDYLIEDKYKEFGIKAVNFTVNRQNEDGSWFYWAFPDTVLRIIDNYHTGFVLQYLNVCRQALKGEFKYVAELKKGLKFYAKNLFLDERIPKMYFNSVYPIDIHSCAQGIITFCELVDIEPNYLNIAKRIARWTINVMQDKEGYFYYRIFKNRSTNKIAYIRWGQAWMLKALSYLI